MFDLLQAANDTIKCLQLQLQQLQQQLDAAKELDRQRVQGLADNTAVATEQQQQLQKLVQQKHEAELATAGAEAKAELQELQQQLAETITELAAAQDQAAEAEQQVVQLQEQLQQAIDIVEQQQLNSEHELKSRWAAMPRLSMVAACRTCTTRTVQANSYGC